MQEQQHESLLRARTFIENLISFREDRLYCCSNVRTYMYDPSVVFILKVQCVRVGILVSGLNSLGSKL